MCWAEHLGYSRNLQLPPGQSWALGSSGSPPSQQSCCNSCHASLPAGTELTVLFHRAFQSAESTGWTRLNSDPQHRNPELSLWWEQGRATLRLCSGTDPHCSHSVQLAHSFSLTDLSHHSSLHGHWARSCLAALQSTPEAGGNESLPWWHLPYRWIGHFSLLSYQKQRFIWNHSVQDPKSAPHSRRPHWQKSVWNLTPTGRENPHSRNHLGLW